MAVSDTQASQIERSDDAFIDALQRELESELVSGWRVDEDAVWIGSTRLLTLARYRKGFESCRWIDDRMRFVSSILRDELDRVAPMPKSYDQAVTSASALALDIGCGVSSACDGFALGRQSSEPSWVFRECLAFRGACR